MATNYVRDWDDMRITPQAAVPVNQIIQLRDGRAALYLGVTAASSGDPRSAFKASGIVSVPKSSGYSLLDGGDVFWDRTNGVATWQRLPANRGYFMGTAYGDALNTDVVASVNLNVRAAYDVRLFGRDNNTFTPAIILTAGKPTLTYQGGLDFLLDSTNEAQKVDALSDDYVLTGAKGIVRGVATVVNGGAAANTKFYLGLASGTHATSPPSVTEYIYFEIDSNNTTINAQSSDGTTTVPKTSTTKTYTAGTPVEFWIDLRNPASCGMYVNGVQVLIATVFNLAAGASNMKLLAWLGKTISTDVMEVKINFLGCRTAEQSTNGV